MKSRLPWMQFNPEEWEYDMAHHPPQIQAWWLLVCGRLHGTNPRGTLTLSMVQWAGILRTSVEQVKHFIDYLRAEQIAELDTVNGKVTISCRRMLREEIGKENGRLRVARFRQKQKNNMIAVDCNSEVMAESKEAREIDIKNSIAQDMHIPCREGEEFVPSVRDLFEWNAAYTNVCVNEALRRMRQWCLSNTSKQKTRRGVRRFITNWLAREQAGQASWKKVEKPPQSEIEYPAGVTLLGNGSDK